MVEIAIADRRAEARLKKLPDWRRTSPGHRRITVVA
jgi:hypothetical protein